MKKTLAEMARDATDAYIRNNLKGKPDAYWYETFFQGYYHALHSLGIDLTINDDLEEEAPEEEADDANFKTVSLQPGGDGTNALLVQGVFYVPEGMSHQEFLDKLILFLESFGAGLFGVTSPQEDEDDHL